MSGPTRIFQSPGDVAVAGMDAFRKQLDDLMGANRNGDSQEVDHKYYDRAVCRLYLCGLCPHELFVNTVSSSWFAFCLATFSLLD